MHEYFYNKTGPLPGFYFLLDLSWDFSHNSTITWKREEILLNKKETIALMSQDHLTPEQFADFSPMKPGYTYGLGVRTNVSSDFSEKGEFGWDGAAGSYTIIDPKNNIAVFYGTHVRNHGNFLYFKHHMDIRDEIYKVLLNR